MHRLRTISLLVLTLCLFSSPVEAQGIPGISDPISVTVSPETPKPNSSVSIKIQSFSVDLDRALIVWTVNGKEENKGVGLKRFDLTAGPTGSSKRVDIAATVVGMGTFKQTIIIKPADVSMLWESDTYTPPFYKGKALHSFNGSFRVVAVPEFIGSDGKRIDPRDLIYTWKKNGEVQGDASGYGKTSFIGSQTSYLRQGEEISVEVSSPRENAAGSGSITIIPTVPKLVLYEKSPLYGPQYETAIVKNKNLENEEITVLAEPYFFSVGSSKAGALTYAWTLNGSALPTFANKPEVTLRKIGGQGVADLSLVVQNQAKLLQGASKNISISYE